MTSNAQNVKVNRGLRAPNPVVLLRWYDKHQRSMPWRAKKGIKANPYHVWLSEIMLQQTTVTAVVPYFLKFIKRWPDLNALASASLDEVLQMWAGLGYYRRARMLHACAHVLSHRYKGIFPQTEAELLALPGFGPYTAAAVAAIAFGHTANVVDGNVERVMARIFAVKTPLPKSKKDVRDKAAKLLPHKRCGDYAQALMDLGATICTPRAPSCEWCPWQDCCQAYALGIQEKLPRREKKKAKPVRRAVAFVVTSKDDRILLRQRPDTGLLAGMMEVPSSPWNEGEMPKAVDVLVHAPLKTKWEEVPHIITHVFTHFTLEVRVLRAFVPASSTRRVKGVWVKSKQLSNQALPSLMSKIIGHALSGSM